MKGGLGLGLSKSNGIKTLINKLINILKLRSTYLENLTATKIVLNKLKNIETSNAYGFLNKLESRSTYFENRSVTRAQLIKLEDIT